MRNLWIVVLAAAAATGCHRRSEDTLDQPGQPVAIHAAEIDKDRDKYRHLVDDTVVWIDRRIAQIDQDADAASPKERAAMLAEADAARAWRARLERRRAAIDDVSPGDWARLKLYIDHDLDQARPPEKDWMP